MQNTKWSVACVAALVVVSLGATLGHEENALCNQDASMTKEVSMMQMKNQSGATVQNSNTSGVRAHLNFIQQPVPMSGQEMATVDTTGMVKKTSGELTFFTYPNDQDMFVSRSITPNGYWEKAQSDEFCSQYGNLVGKADFLDVGANIGTWSIPMAQCLQRLHRGGSVIAVEALGRSAMHLAASAHANSLDNIDLFNYAVGEGGPEDQTVEKVNTNNKGGTGIDVNSIGMHSPTEPVSMTTLDAIVADTNDHTSNNVHAGLWGWYQWWWDKTAGKDSRIFAMKMDVEGYELYALQGAPNLLRGDHRPCLIFIELRIDTHEPSAKAMQMLEDSGYERIQDSSTRDEYLMRHKDFATCAQRFASI